MEWNISYKDEHRAMKEASKWPPRYRNALFQLLGLFKIHGGRNIPNVKIEPLKGALKGLMKAYLKKNTGSFIRYTVIGVKYVSKTSAHDRGFTSRGIL